MRTATSNLVIITTEMTDKSITGLAMDTNNDINIKFAVTNNDVNRAVFVPEANLVVTGNFRIGREICTIGMWVKSIVISDNLDLFKFNELPFNIRRLVERKHRSFSDNLQHKLRYRSNGNITWSLEAIDILKNIVK